MLLISSLAREASYAGAAGGTSIVASVYGFFRAVRPVCPPELYTQPQLWILTLALFCEMLSHNTRVPGKILFMKVFSVISEQFCHTLEAVLNRPPFHEQDIQQLSR